jgi:hypothetical protein
VKKKIFALALAALMLLTVSYGVFAATATGPTKTFYLTNRNFKNWAEVWTDSTYVTAKGNIVIDSGASVPAGYLGIDTGLYRRISANTYLLVYSAGMFYNASNNSLSLSQSFGRPGTAGISYSAYALTEVYDSGIYEETDTYRTPSLTFQ